MARTLGPLTRVEDPRTSQAPRGAARRRGAATLTRGRSSKLSKTQAPREGAPGLDC